MAGAIYLADTSVYVLQGRHPLVRRRFEALLTEGRLAACHMTALEYLNFRLPGLIIAATAEANGATVLHYDADYDRIARVTGQPVEWVAEKGSL